MAEAKKLEPTKRTQPPRKKRKRKPRREGMSVEEMHRRWPLLKKLAAPPSEECREAWDAAFRARPDAMHAILRDLIKQHYAQPGRIGQRPMPREEEVDFQALFYGEMTEQPMIEMLPKLMHVSERMFCERIDMSRRKFQRMMAGEYHPDIYELRQIAEAVRKPPSYFVEYRKTMAVAAFANLIEDRPGIAGMLYRDYLEAKAS